MKVISDTTNMGNCKPDCNYEYPPLAGFNAGIYPERLTQEPKYETVPEPGFRAEQENGYAAEEDDGELD